MRKENGKTRKKLLLLGGVLLVLVGAYGAYRVVGKRGASAPTEETATVEKRTVDDVIEVSGYLKPRKEQEIRAPAAGIVESVRLTAGATVKTGDLIASMDATEAKYETKKIEYQIEQERFAGNRRKIELLESELAMRRKAVEDLMIRAHLDGKISSLDIKAGDVLKEGDSYGRVIDVSSLTADVEIPEIDIPRAKVGLPATFRFSALPGLVANGRLDSFPAEARINTQGLSVLDAKLVIDAPPEGLLPGYTFDAVITAGEPKEVLVVDSRAVNYRAGKPEVQKKEPDGKWKTVKVVTEGFGSGYLRIVDGLAEGDVLKIFLTPQPELKG